MQPTDSAFTAPPEQLPPKHSLFHEWFVEYNPAYLFSAALVLAGLTLVSCDLADADALAGLGVTAVAEIYALSLIAGAALLWRLDHRRVAVMVGLLAALYQCDLTLHVEMCSFLDHIGWLAALAWAALFHVKLRLLAKALQLKLSRSALLVPTFAAIGLAVLPHLLHDMAPVARPTLVALFVFAVGACALWTSRRVDSSVGFDYRGRRTIHGTWLMWGAGMLAHVTYWGLDLRVDLVRLLPVGVLLATRWMHRERAVWIVALGVLGVIAAFDRTFIPCTAAMISVVLVLRAYRTPMIDVLPSAHVPRAPSPYRGVPPEIVAALPETFFLRAPRVVRERLLVGAAASAHFGAWTALASSLGRGLWWIDLALLVVCAVFFWRGRRLQSLVPLPMRALQVAITTGVLVEPRGAAQWGIWAIVIGFVMLGGSLVASWWIQRARRDEGDMQTA